MFVGWTYEIDADAEVTYTNQDPTGWMVDHRWTFDKHPHISKIGRGGVRDFFTDFRFQKVLELADRDSEHEINVECSVRDMRYPQFDIRMADSDIVKFLIGNVDYAPEDLVCIALMDVVMFENAGEFAVYYEVPATATAGGFSVNIYPHEDTSIPSFTDLIIGKDGMDFHKIAFAYEYDTTYAVVDCEITKYQNQHTSTDNQKFFSQQMDWIQKVSGKVAVICDDSVTSGILDPNNKSDPTSCGLFLETRLGKLGEGWDIFNHSNLTSEQCASGEFWDNYTAFIYLDRLNSGQLPKLKKVCDKVNDGSCGLIVWGEGTNANELVESITGAERNTLMFYGVEQKIDPDWGSAPHPTTNGVTLTTGLVNIRGYKSLSGGGTGIRAVSEWYDFVGIQDKSQIKEVRLFLQDNDRHQPKRRKFWIEIDESAGVNKTCGRSRALITVVDDEVQLDEDDSWTLSHSHTTGNENMTESFKFAANKWYQWDNKLYTDLSARKYRYTLGFPNCGGSREVNAEVRLTNRSGSPLSGQVFNQPFNIGGGETGIYDASAYRVEQNPSSEGFGYLLIESPNEQEWDVQFRFLDSAPCPGEDPMPVECGKDYLINTRKPTTIPYYDDIPDDCTHFSSQIILSPCGSARTIPVLVRLYNDDREACDVIIRNRNGEEHKERLLGLGGVINIEMQCPYPTKDSLFPPPDDYAWIVEIEAFADEDTNMPNFSAVIDVQDTSTCGMGGPGFECPEANLPSGEVGYNWDLGGVIDGAWYALDNQDNLCTQIYDGFKMIASDLWLPWDNKNYCRYRVELEFEARAKGQYSLDVQPRFNGDYPANIWTSNNRPENWKNEYILINGDYNVGGTELFVEIHTLSFRALDGDARLNFKWKVRFNREELVGGVWIPANRKPYEGWTRLHSQLPIPYVAVPDLIPESPSVVGVADNILAMSLLSGLGGQVPEKGNMQIKERYTFEYGAFDKVVLSEIVDGEFVMKASYKREQLQEDPDYLGSKMVEFEYIVTEAEGKDIIDNERWDTYFAVAKLEAYTAKQSQNLGNVRRKIIGGSFTHVPYIDEVKPPVAATAAQFTSLFPIETNKMVSGCEAPNSYSNSVRTTMKCEGFNAVSFNIYEGLNPPKSTNIAYTVSVSWKSFVGVIMYDQADNIIYQQRVMSNSKTFTGVRCNQVKRIEVYSVDGKSFLNTVGGSSLSIASLQLEG